MNAKKINNLELLKKEKISGTIKCQSKPISVWLESTCRCNLKCITCPRTYLPYFKGFDLDSEVFEIIKLELLPYAQTIHINGFGEPMMAKNFNYILQEVIRYNSKVTFFTNGTLLTEYWLKIFLQNNIQFTISLDGSCKDTCQKIRPGIDFNKIIESIRLFNRLKKTEYRTSKTSITIAFVALKTNINELPELLTLAHHLEIDYVRILPFNISLHSRSLRKESLINYKNLANRYFMLAKKKAEEYGIKLEFSLYKTNNNKFNKKLTNKNYRFPQKCYAPWEKIMVRANGDIVPCCESGEIMGNIKKKDFSKIWNGAKYQNFRRRINTNFPPVDCRNCSMSAGINAGNPENTKSNESQLETFRYFIEDKLELIKYGLCYLTNYFMRKSF
jgi:radical SAM protein with 4Fe4S-binding SPASM domain